MKRLLLWGMLAGGLALGWGFYTVITKRMQGPRWDNLTPETKRMALEVLARAERAGLKVMLWDGWRNAAEQQKNIAAGTSWVSSPLNSMHTWGEAVDIVFDVGLGVPSWPDPNIPENMAKWKQLGEIGEAVGFTWGGRWQNFDGAHLQRQGIRATSLRSQYSDDPLAYLRAQGVNV